jgi:hypothetical protein
MINFDGGVKLSKVDGSLRKKLAAAPDRQVSLIVRTHGDPTPHLEKLSQLGMKVKRQFKLLPGLSVRGKASAALSLAKERWIVRIEEDKPVKKM